MTDSQLPTVTPPADEAAPAKSSAALPNKKTLPVLLSLVFLLVLASVGYFQYRLEMLLAQNQVLQQQQAVHQTQLSRQIEQNAGQQTLMEKSDDAQSQLEQKLLGLNSLIQQLPGARAEDWKLAEVEYLLRLANQRVTLQNEADGAQALLNAADTILAELNDPALVQVRAFIAQERLALGQANSIDRQGVYLSIQALKQRIETVIKPPQNFYTEKETVQPTQEDSSDSVAVTFWTQLKQLVQIRHRDDAFEAPLNQSQYQLLQHSLLLMLEQAQWALLKQEQTLYRQSLQNAMGWIDGKLRHTAAVGLLDQLKTLSEQNIIQELPDISQSLRQLRSVVKARTYRPVTPDNKSQKADQEKSKTEQEQA